MKISVLMPVCNGEKYLHASMKNIIDQTFSDFEFLIMDDGSTDRTHQILEAYAKKDHRIKIFRQKNSGIVASLNALASHAKAELIARMDVDDASYPQRLEIQYSYMEKHPQTVLLGATNKVIHEKKGARGLSDTFGEDFLNRWFLTYNCAFVHSSVMFRKNVFTACGGYRQSEYPAEDYGLWIRMKNFGLIENLQTVLGEYRFNVESISGKNFRRQIKIRDRLNKTNFEDIYKNDQIPDLKKVVEALQKYPMDRHRKQIFSKLACLTGCFLVEKGGVKRAAPYFRWSFQLSKKRLDALLNLILAPFKKAVYFSVDAYVKLRTATAKIRWFKAAGRNS